MLFSPLFVPPSLEKAVSTDAWFQAMLDAESALAQAEAQSGVIPDAAAEEIAASCLIERFDPQAIVVEARGAGNPVEPLARALRRLVSAEASPYVHYGATSQDILDTASMLITKRALVLIEGDLARLARSLASLTQQHRASLMVGRTLLQHALPITFGFKTAGWLSGVLRAEAALHHLNQGCLSVELGGAAGTLAALGESGPATISRFATILNLAEPDLPWHTERGRLVEIASALALAAGISDKVALDIVLLAQTEVGEVAEGNEGGGSSTMPQKRNPIGSVLTRACVREAHGNIEILMRTMAQEHERAAGAWHAEWQALSGALAFTGGAVAALREVAANLEVYPERMRENLDATNGLVLAERVSLLLAERIGRDRAHALVRSLGRQTQERDGTLRDTLLADEEVRRHLSEDEIERAMDPATYLGSANAFIDRVLSSYHAGGSEGGTA